MSMSCAAGSWGMRRAEARREGSLWVTHVCWLHVSRIALRGICCCWSFWGGLRLGDKAAEQQAHSNCVSFLC